MWKKAVLSVSLCLAGIANSFSQALISPVDISEVSSVIHLAPGLCFLSAYEYPYTGDAINLDTGEKVKIPSEPPYIEWNEIQLIDQNTFVNITVEDSDVPIAKIIIYFQKISKGPKKIAWYYRNNGDIKNTVYPEVNIFRILGFENNVLIFYVILTTDAQFRQKKIIAQIGGDWTDYVGQNNVTNLADLNHDGKVDSLDLLIFSEAWKASFSGD